jgi:uracil-DNA glycosylase family 4
MPCNIGLPAPDCGLCPRLVAFREQNTHVHPAFFNGAVPSFGDLDAALLIVGLAPGLKGANRTGRPFTGDYAGELLYPTLLQYGWASGVYDTENREKFTLINARITNTVRCVPPLNKPLPAEINTCSTFLRNEIAAMPNVRFIIALGTVAYTAVLKNSGKKPAAHPFKHGGIVTLTPKITLISSYHCSRYNTSTKRLTTAMFHAIFDKLKELR